MSTSSQRSRPPEGKIGLDSRIQVQHKIMEEIEEWAKNYEIRLSFKEKADLVLTIDEELFHGAIYPPDFPETVEDDVEHYNYYIEIFDNNN